jgi:predicted DNA repair protein MutK
VNQYFTQTLRSAGLWPASGSQKTEKLRKTACRELEVRCTSFLFGCTSFLLAAQGFFWVDEACLRLLSVWYCTSLNPLYYLLRITLFVTTKRQDGASQHHTMKGATVASKFFSLFDDIATILDDVSVMTKVAMKKTAGVLGDDLALNAQQVTGVNTERELPVVWAVAKGSALNKLILIPIALALNYLLPSLITPLLIFGGAFLCYEGVHKLAHKFLHTKEEDEAHHKEISEALSNDKIDMVAFEKEKIKGAITTDFILSAEILVIALGEVSKMAFSVQLGVLLAISVAMTIGVYGLVAGIVKLDDAGVRLTKSEGTRRLGEGLLWFAPKLMKVLSIVGTAAMFMVGGGIVAHGVPTVYHFIHGLETSLGGLLGGLLATTLNALLGVLVGAICLTIVNAAQKITRSKVAAAN